MSDLLGSKKNRKKNQIKYFIENVSSKRKARDAKKTSKL